MLYIAGVGRSGSTLLARMLGQIPGFASVGELHHIWETGALELSATQLCGCGLPYRECPFWNEVAGHVGPLTATELEEMGRLKKRVDRVRYLPLMLLGSRAPRTYRRRRELYVRSLLDLYSALSEIGDTRVIVDASKDLSTLYLLSGMPQVEVSVVHLVRDPRGVAYSWQKKVARPEFQGAEVLMARRGSLRLAGYWSYSNLLAEWSREGHRSYLLLRYEDLIREPRKSLEAICDKVGGDPPELGFLDSRGVHLDRVDHTVKGNPSRFATGRVELELDEAWRRELGAWPRFAVAALTAPWLLRYGYFDLEGGLEPPE